MARRLKHTTLPWAAATLVAALAFVGCKQAPSHDSAEGSIGAQAKQAAQGAQDASPEQAKGGGTAAVKLAEGALAERLPRDCSLMRLNVNLERFGKYQETGNAIAAVATQALARTSADERYVAPVVELLRRSGVEPAKDLKEVAACADSQSSWLALLEVDLSGLKEQPDALLRKVVAEAGKRQVKLETAGATRYLSIPESAGGALGFVAPGVLGFASNPTLLDRARSSEPAGTKLSGGPDQLAAIHFPAGDERGKFTLTGQPERLTASIYLPLNDAERRALRKQAARYLTQAKGVAMAHTNALDLDQITIPALESLLGDFEQLELSISKQDLKAEVTVSTQEIRKAVSAIASIEPSRFEALVASLQ